MKKSYLFLASAAMILAGCADESYNGNSSGIRGNNGEIAFSSRSATVTRADFSGAQAAEKLNGNFIVYGFKTNAAEEAGGSTDQMVFDHYNVNYTAGTANTTESNTADWEYVGLANHGGSINPQTIKYWDYSATDYIFSAVSGVGITTTKTKTGATVYDKGWTVNIPAGGDLSSLYASDREPIAKINYGKEVNLTFRSLITKIRFAMYETVPGYEVHVDKFYYGSSSSWNNTETNFAINGTFKKANATAVTPITVTYYDDASGIENRPKVSYNDGDVTTGTWGVFGANIQATEAIGTSSMSATYDQSDKSYTLVLPYESSLLSTPAENVMTLYVDYTLTSTDGSGETIKVKHASAKVPTNFNQWKPNFAYTYLFKISDNTNGTTGNPGDPDDPTHDPEDPTGLFPITFDALVITDDTDVQQTITSVSDPSITTYQKGVIVTENDEYVAGDNIYFENGTLDVSNYEVYEVNNYGAIETKTTEEIVANWKNNFCVLTKVATTDASSTGIPLANGTSIAKTANQAYYFTPAAGKTYVIANNAINSATQYKVVKIAGNLDADPIYTQSIPASAAISATDGTVVYTLKSNSPAANTGVYGAAPLLKIYNSSSVDVTTNFTIKPGASAGNYKIALTPVAIAAGGVYGDYTVKFNGDGDQTFNVDIDYVLRNADDDADVAAITIVAGNTTGETVINKIAGAAADGDVTNVPEGITVEKTATGTYKVTAAEDLAHGAYSIKIANQSLTINVDSYKFTADLVITKALTGTSSGTLTLQKNGGTATGITTLTGSDDDIATFTATDGVYTYTAVKGGSFDVTYENAKAKVTVNAYTIATPASIKKSTGMANIEVKCNDKTIVASTASLVETAKPADAVYTVTTNGQIIRFSNASKAGAYEFDYKVGTTVVAHVVVTVTD